MNFAHNFIHTAVFLSPRPHKHAIYGTPHDQDEGHSQSKTTHVQGSARRLSPGQRHLVIWLYICVRMYSISSAFPPI